MKRITTFVVALLMLSLAGLSGAVTATYNPQSFFIFKLGPDISTALTPANTFGPNKLVAHIGTLTIFAENEGLMRPYLMTNDFIRPYMFSGVFNDWGGGVHETEFYLYAFTSLSAAPFPLWLEDGTEALAGYSNAVIEVNPFVVDFFVVSHFDAQYYEEGELYEHVGGTLGAFNVTKLGYDNKGKWIHVYIPVNEQELPEDGSPPTNPIPVIGDVPGAQVPSIPYGGEPPPVTYLLSIVDVISFPIEQAYDSSSIDIATCQLVLQNASGTDNAVHITFNSSTPYSPFRLHHTDSSIIYMIPYSLYFLGDEVVPGEQIPWESLQNGLNESIISVGNIDHALAENAPAGNYRDTIYVEVESVN